MTFPPKVWDGVLRRLQNELAPVSYEMWIANLAARCAATRSDRSEGCEQDLGGGEGDGRDDDANAGDDIRCATKPVIEILCPSRFHAVRVRDFFSKPIAAAIEAEWGRRISLRVTVGQAAEGENDTAGREAKAAREAGETRAHRARETSAVASSACDAAEAPGPEPGDDAEGPTVRLAMPRPRRIANTQTIADALGHVLSDSAERAPEPAPRGPASTSSVPAVMPASPATPPAPVSCPSPAPAGSVAARDRGAKRKARGVSVRHDAHPRAAAASFGAAAPSAPAMRQPTFPLTFDSFTVGPANALAREATLALASPTPDGGQLSLNQVFIVSGSGLGKTHLARAATAQGARTLGPRARYTTAESFTSEFTAAIRTDKMNDFKRRYRGECDLFVVDDVQFLEGKAATQLEFFHTVQHVLDAGGRVLLTGDRFPQELTHLDARVRERITSSFVAEVRDPDDALRGSILRAKAAHGGVRLPDECVELLVDRVEGSVRELEGALVQLVTVASLFKRPIDLQLTRESLEGRTRKLEVVSTPATVQLVIETVAGFFKTPPAALASRSRRRDVLVPRQIAMYLCRRFTDASLADVGRALNRDHPAVANAIRKIERNLLENVRLRYQVEALIARLRELGYRPLHSAD